MFGKDQSQDVGSGAIAIQAGGHVTINGVSATEARAIALDVAKLTFYELTGVAKETMSVRVEEITEKVISKLEKDFPEGLKKATDPDFQHALFTVQKQYGRTGDADLGDLLVDLLVDRSKQDQRDILQIVLNESLEVAPKLTNAQLAILSIVFVFRYTINHGVFDDSTLGRYFDLHVKPFADVLVKNSASYQHLEFTGCGSIQVATSSLEEGLMDSYAGLFTTGFDVGDIVNQGLSAELRAQFFEPCLSNPAKMQVVAINKETLERYFEQFQVSHEDRQKIRTLFAIGRLSPAQARQKCIALRPYMQTVFDCWSNSAMKSFTLTSVGMAIGHANVKRLIGEFSDLSIWVN